MAGRLLETKTSGGKQNSCFPAKPEVYVSFQRLLAIFLVAPKHLLQTCCYWALNNPALRDLVSTAPLKTIGSRFGLFLVIWAMQCPAPAQSNPSAVLSINQSSNQTVIVSWSNTAPGFVLESVDALPSAKSWQGILQAPQVSGNQLKVTQAINSITGSARFYRLIQKGNPAGLDYLLAAQNSDGSWGNASQTPFHDTAEALETLAALGKTDSAAFNAAESALAAFSPRNNDDLSRQAIALGFAGWDVSASAANLLSGQNLEIFDLLNTNYPGRGWGLASGFGNSTLDTALVVRALKAGGKAGGLSVVQETLAGSAASPTHPFDVPAGSSTLTLNVRKLSGTVRFSLTYPNSAGYYVDLSTGQTPTTIGFPIATGTVTFVAQNLTGSPATYTAEVGLTAPDGFDVFRVTTALTYLGLAQNADGGWGISPGRDSQLMVTAEVVRSLAAWGLAFGPQSILQSAKAWLLAHQNLDGGFSSVPGASNVSETGLAVLAILAVDPTASLGNASSFLKSAQLPDGSWGSNAYQTALAMHALRMPPVVGTIPGQSIINPYSFVPITLDNFVHDPDNTANQMQWSASGNILLSVSVVNRVAFITYSPSNNPSISEQLTFTATDPSGFTGSATATFVVSSNQPPVVSPIPGQNVGAPQPFAAIYLDNYVTDPDEATNQLTWTVTGNTQLVVSVSNRVVNITYNTNISTAFTEWLTFKATDPAGLSGASTTNFSVAPDQAPVVSGIPGQTVTAPYAFLPINLDNYVNDPDNAANKLTWQVTGSAKLTVTLTNRVAFLTYPANPRTNFTEQLTFRATDPVGKSGSTTATFIVNSNYPPVVSAIPGQSVYVPYSFTPINLDNYVSDPDEPASQMTWQVTGNTKLTVTLSNRVALITYPANTSSNFTEALTFTATDPVGFSASASASFTVNSNRPPVVSAIPGQTNQVPVPFGSINLYNYVSDPGDSPAQMTWTVTGNVQFTVAINNRVATISYPTGTTNSISELLTFKATDPWGLFGTATSRFAVTYSPPDYIIPRGGSVTDHRTFSMSVPAYNQWVILEIVHTNYPAPAVTYTDLGRSEIPPASDRMDYRINASPTAVLGTYPMSVEYRVYDANTNQLGPLTNNIYNRSE